jgi:hypothetical protein
MIRVKAMLCAENVIRDTETNQVTIYNVIEQVNVMGFPALLKGMTIFVFLERETEDAQVVDCQVLLKMDDTQLKEIRIQPDFEDKLRNRTFVRIEGMPIHQEGRFSAILLIDGKEKSQYDFPVVFAGETRVTATNARSST